MLLAWYSAERCTQSTALRLSSAATVAVAGADGVAFAVGPACGDETVAQPEASRAANRMAGACTRIRGKPSNVERRAECSEAVLQIRRSLGRDAGQAGHSPSRARIEAK